MDIGDKNVISLAFWRNLQHLKAAIAERGLDPSEFIAKPAEVLEREHLDASIEIESEGAPVSLVEILKSVSDAQREAIVQYLKPNYSPARTGDVPEAAAGLSSTANVSAQANAVSVVNGGVVSNAVAFANVITNVNVVSNVNLVAAVPLAYPEVSGE